MKAKIERIRVYTACDEAGDVSHVSHQKCADFLTNFGNAGKIRNFHESRVADEDNLRMFSFGETFNFVVIEVAFWGDAIINKLIDFSGARDWTTMSEVTTVAKIHGQNFVTRLTPGKINRFIGIGTRVGLDVGVIGMKKFHRAGNSEAFDFINISLTAIITIIR